MQKPSAPSKAVDQSQHLHALSQAISAIEDYAIFLLDSQGIIVTWNKGAEKFKGYKAEEIIGQHFSKFYSEEDRKAKKTEMELEVATRQGKCIDEGWRIRKDGSKFWAYVVITALKDTDGKLLGFSKVTRDLTERRLNEELLQRGNFELEKKVAERTTQLLETNKELEQFAYVASHDLQEPLRKIIMFSERLKSPDDAPDENKKDYVEKIYKSAVRMRTVIEDLLDYSRLQSEKTEKHAVDLNTVMEEVLYDLEHKIEEAGAKINIEPLPILSINASRMRHLFQNLIVNALKFKKKDASPVISIHCKITQYWVEIYFSDNGIGFEQQYADMIFKPFTRLHSKHQYDGSGIGLALCQKIAHQHGGKIIAYGNPGEGATFVLTLPKE